MSQYLRQELHGLLESSDKSHIPEMYQYIKELGGYFKRFNGGLLSPWIKPSADAGEMDLHARATLTFFEVRTFSPLLTFFFRICVRLFFPQVDRNLEAEAAAKVCGSTASVAILHSLDSPSTPFFLAQSIALTVAHVGYVSNLTSSHFRTDSSGHLSDTRILLCSSDGGTAFAMTENHRAEGRIESVRLRRMMGTGVIADSFGDARCVQSVFRQTRKFD